MAEGIFNWLSKENRARSCGIYALEGQKPTENSVRVMGAMGIDISGHRSKGLDLISDKYDLILTMTEDQAQYIRDYIREEGVYSLIKYTDKVGGDILDPYGGDQGVYLKTAKLLFDKITKLIKILEA